MLFRSYIPGEMYPKADNGGRVPSIGVLTTLVSSSDLDDDAVYNFTKALFENLDAFKKRHPAFEALDKESMLRGGFAPMHPGAAQYFKEMGMIE